VDYRRDELRAVWEAKCLDMSTDALNARRNKASARLLLQGIVDPTLRRLDHEREAIEEEAFTVWLAEKRYNGFDKGI